MKKNLIVKKNFIATLIVMAISFLCVGSALAEYDPDHNWKTDMTISREVAGPVAALTAEQKADMHCEAGAGYVAPQEMFEGRELAQRPAPMTDSEKADMFCEAGAGYISPQKMAKMRR